MCAKDYQFLKQLERELIAVLKQEYSFYQELYIALDKQRDLLQFDRDTQLLDLFSEIERYRSRIKSSEDQIALLRQKHPETFKAAAVLPEVKKIANRIASLVRKNMNVVKECEEYLEGRYARIKEELGELRNSRKILQYITDSDPSPQFVDGKK